MHRGVGTTEAYSGHCFAALMKERRENGVRVEKIVELQVHTDRNNLVRLAIQVTYVVPGFALRKHINASSKY